MASSRRLSDLERDALTIRHQAALDLLRAAPKGAATVDSWRLLLAVVAPSPALREESERRARELLERAAAA